MRLNDVILALLHLHSGLTQLALCWSCIKLGPTALDGLTQLALFRSCITLGLAPLRLLCLTMIRQFCLASSHPLLAH